MYLTDLSIKRPVVATVMSLILVIFGLVVFNEIPTDELPDVERPIVTIQTNYQGASAEIVDTQITQKIEDRVGGTPGLINIESMSEDGSSRIEMTFKSDLDLDNVANDVRSFVARVVDELPEEASAPEVYKQSAGFRTTMWMSFSSDFMSDMELTDYADRYLTDYFATVEGVGRVRLGGEREISLRIWLDPIALAARDLTTQEVEQTLRSENLEFPSGRIESKDIDLTIKLENAYDKIETYKNLPLKKSFDGSITKLSDVARVEFGPVSTRTVFKGNGKQVVGIGIYQQSDANTIKVANRLKKKIKEIQPTLPDGTSLEVSFDRSNYISTAIYEVYKTLVIALILVTIIIYLFLGNIRALVVPIIALPVSLISTFLAIYFFDFSINLFTLMALVLAIGIVVDDAIVMLENIVRRVEKGETSLVAAYKGSKQVSFAIIATTLVLVAVFIPLIFIKGLSGTLYTQTAVTLSFAVIISSFVALSLSPMIASKVLVKKNIKSKVSQKFEVSLNKFRDFYKRTLLFWLKRKKEIIIFLIIILALTTSVFLYAPKELMPKEDRGAFFVIIKAPESSGFEYTSSKSEEIEGFLLPEVGKGEYRRLLLRVPGFGKSSTQVNSGFIIVLLEHWDDRKRDGQRIMMESFRKISKVPGVLAFPVMPQGIRTGGVQKPVQFVLLGNTYEDLIKWKEVIKNEARKNKNLINVEDDFNQTKAILNVKIDQEKTSDLGVSTLEIGRSIETMFGSRNVTKFTKDGREYDIILQGDIKNRKEPSNLAKVYVRSKNTGKLVSISNLVSLEEEGIAPILSRYNRQKAITISANIVGDYSLSDALNFLEKTTNDNFPSARIAYKGESEELRETSYQIYLIFALALLTAYLVMAAQFESFKHPFTIMLTVPLAIFGGILGLLVVGSSINIFSQIALIILIGLATKNGILIVEFANQLRDEGKDIEKSIIESANIRLRPILMTSISTIIGVLPLVFSSGPGEASRLTVGITILFGMIFSTFFTLYVIPTIYLAIGKNTKSINHIEKELKKQLD
ncbi:efflux RND transporter permease subunit [Candidatus Pelagibacter communis]|uniref:efflux RND transporter permease subunit n=1 Tax=Pelagibacter ubique TaxID=198252 RepID=UPI00094D65E6|nr:efflux RND transporter permease subunit [Candidatus Pelagibacter ubique]